MLNNYIIVHKLNHNVVIAEDRHQKRWILFGRGIGFQKNTNDVVQENAVENKYILFDEKNLEKYSRLMKQSDELASLMSEWIIHEMQKRFNCDYNKHLHITLLDHLDFALKRLKGNIVIHNLFDSELKFIYPDEYQFSVSMLRKIEEELKIKFPESEAGMITLHIHSALHNEKVSNTALIMNVVSFAVKYLENKHGDVQDDILKNRLIIHLKFAVKRSLEQVQLQNDLNELIKDKFKDSYQNASEIAKQIEKEYSIHLNDSEIVYLAIHLQNIFHF